MGVDRKKFNLWVARIMPIAMVLIVGFATWVFLSLVCTRHLLVWQKRKATAVTLIVIYSILLLLLASSYLRAVVTLAINPGFVPKGPPRNVSPDGSQQQLNGAEDGYSEAGSGGTLVTAAPAFASSTEVFSSPPLPGSPSAAAESERLSVAPSDQVPQTPNSTTLLNPPPPLLNPPPHHATHSPHTANGMQGRAFARNSRPQEGTSPSDLRCFLDKEIFVCEGDGLPQYCSKCNCWKPDRSHHCSEIGRCVWRMDHFCPWVGGCVAETSFRYFFQVVVYGLLYCLFLIVSIGVLLRERSKANEGMNPKWVGVLILACIFGIFSAGMTYSTAELIIRDLGTIDSLSARTKVYQLAIHDPNPPPADHINAYQPNGPRVWLPPNPAPGESRRCFAIARTQPGENPWKCNTVYESFCLALGGGFWQWFSLAGVPKPGSAGGERGFYPWNAAIITRLKQEAGIATGEKA